MPLEGWYNTDITPHLFLAKVPGAPAVVRRLGKMTEERYNDHRRGAFQNVHYLNVAKRFPFKDCSVDAVFSSHVIEHLTRAVARHMLAESLRVMRPGGVCRVAAPSLKWALDMYDPADPSRMLNAIFEHDQSNPKNRHQWMYTEESLATLMRDVGFMDVEICEYRQGRLPEVERLDNRPSNSIYVEGIKQGGAQDNSKVVA